MNYVLDQVLRKPNLDRYITHQVEEKFFWEVTNYVGITIHNDVKRLIWTTMGNKVVFDPYIDTGENPI